MRTLPLLSALASRTPEGGIAADRLRVDRGSACLGLAAMVLVLGFAPLVAYAACSDEPKAKVDWSGCEKQRLITGKANLQGARLGGAQFDGSDFAQANLAGADLSKPSLDRVRLSGADLSAAVGLTQAQLDTACSNAQTRLPAGLKPPSSWPCPKDD